MGIGVYPGTFDPPTVAHVAVAEAAWRHAGLTRVDLVISVVPLGKPRPSRQVLAGRVQVLQRLASSRPWLAVGSISAQLLAEIAIGYDAVIMGADKWDQVTDVGWYGGSSRRRDIALEGLPLALIAPRPPYPLPEVRPGRVEILDIAPHHHQVSSSAVRAGRREWIAPELGAFDAATEAEGDVYQVEGPASLPRMPGNASSAPGQPASDDLRS